MDSTGNLFGTGPSGVWIISPQGKALGRIEAPEVPANVAWGDDGKTLYLTARSSVYRIRLTTSGAELSVPWAVALVPSRQRLLADVQLSVKAFHPSDNAPAVVSLRAGSLGAIGGRVQVQPVERLDVELWQNAHRIGLLARLRDVLPGRYAFGLTGRGPLGGRLANGVYLLRIVAFPPGGARPSVERVRFTIR